MNGEITLDGGETIMAEKIGTSTQEKMAAMREAAAEKRAKAKKELEAALLGKSKKEQEIYKLKKRIAKLKQTRKKLSDAHRNRIVAALGTAVIDYHKIMKKPDEVVRQLQLVADALGDTSKKDQSLKADINEGIAMIVEERRTPPADASAKSADADEHQHKAQDGKEGGLNAPSADKDESKEPAAKPASPPRRKKTALNKEKLPEPMEARNP